MIASTTNPACGGTSGLYLRCPEATNEIKMIHATN